MQFFELSDGASDADYNAYNYMVLTAHAKPQARTKIPSVVHADGTGRLQIVREATDPLTYAYLKALGRRIGVEVAVNTSFNVAGPIAQTPAQALDTLRRSKGLDAVLMFSEEGPVFVALHGGTGRSRAANDSANGSRRGRRRRASGSKSRFYSTSSTLSGPPPKAFCASAACMNSSRSPSSTPAVLEVDTPVRRSFTI